MAYDEDLADRIRQALEVGPDVAEKRMFGGLAFLRNGNMAVAASSDGGLMVRVDPSSSEGLLDEPKVRRMEMRGRQMDGWLLVEASAVQEDDDLQRWVGVGLQYAGSLPPK